LPVLIYGTGTNRKSSSHVRQTEFVAAAHAGRKGTQARILGKLLEKLYQKFEIKKLYIWFGPAICETSYQIDRETDLHYDLISENQVQIRDFFRKHQLDSQNILKLDIDLGCTFHEQDKYYSYRITGPGVKSNYSFIGIGQNRR